MRRMRLSTALLTEQRIITSVITRWPIDRLYVLSEITRFVALTEQNPTKGDTAFQCDPVECRIILS
jgi:hypothetical protein